MSAKMKNSNCITYTDEDYENGLKMLNLPMKMFLDTLEYNPRIVFVKLNDIGENYFTNESVHKTRNRSVVKLLSPSQVKQKAIQDVKLMCSTIQKMILASGKLITSGIKPFQTVSVKPAFLVNCKTCKATFSKRSDLVNHIADNHPDIPLQSCTFCGKKFIMLRGLVQHINMCHAMIMIRNRSKEKSRKRSGSFPPFKTHSSAKNINKDNVTSFKYLNDSGLAEVEDISDQKEKTVKDDSSCNYNSKDSNETFFIRNNESSSLSSSSSLASSSYSLGKSNYLTDSFERGKSIGSANLTCSNLENPSELEIPEIISSLIQKDEGTGKSSESQVTVTLPTEQHDVRKAVFEQGNRNSGKSNEELDIISSSNTNNSKPETLEKALVGTSALCHQDMIFIPNTLKDRKIPDFDSDEMLISLKNAENKSITVKYVDSNLENGRGMSNETSDEPENTFKDNDLTELNSIQQDEVDLDNILVVPNESQKRVLITKYKKMEIMPLSSQNYEDKTADTKAVVLPVGDQMFPEKICCICLDIINVTRQIFDKQQYSKFKSHECPFCGVRYADIYFEHHVAKVHLVCNKDECESRVILTGSQLRKLLDMQIKIECMHVNCNHNFRTGPKKSKGNLHDAKLKYDETPKGVDEDSKDIKVFVNNENRMKLQEFDTTENSTESCWKSSDLKFSIKAEPCSSIKEEEDCSEENEHVRYTNSSLPTVDTLSCDKGKNEVSSGDVGGYLHQVSQKSRCDESSEAIKVESSEFGYCCCVCKENFCQEQKLLAHLFHHHRFSYPFTCDVCFLCYKHAKDLRAHVQVHGKHMVSEKTKCNRSDTAEEKVSLKKCCFLSDKNAALEFYVKGEPSLYIEESTAEGQHLESVKSNLTKDSSTIECSSVILDIPGKHDLLKLNSTQEENSFMESKKVASSVAIPTIHCSHARIKSKSNDAEASTFHIKNEQKDSPSKKKKMKIPCVVEKVEYPLDLHNLYAHSRKAQDSKVANSSVELELESNCSAECNNTNLLSVEAKKKNSSPMGSDTSCVEKTTATAVRRKMPTSFSLSTKKIKKDDCQVHTAAAATTDEVIFQCKTCEKTFDFKRSYSEHMFFMHDAIFDDSVVCDLLKPSSKSKNIENASQQNTGSKIYSCTNAELAHSAETRGTMDDFNTIKACSIHPGSLAKLEKNVTDEIINNNNARNCSQCGERYVQVTSYFQHRYDIHGDDSLVHVCENCSKVLITVNMVNSHLCTQVDTFSCKDCEIKFVNGLALKQHNTTMHFESIGPHVCHDCKKCFLTNRMLQKHKSIIHSGGSRRSSIGVKKEEKKKSRWDGSNGSRANTSNQGENMFQIVDDENVLKKDQAVSLVKPLMTKRGRINNLTCPFCKFVLQSIRRLQAHLMVNHSKVTDLCLLCNRLFAFGRGIRHMLDFHIIPACNKDNEYVLSWEGDPKKDVKEAIQVLGEKRLLAICSYDDYTTMTDSASFQCRHCSMTYSAVRFYRTHYVQRHDDFCALCGESFKSNKDFTLHVENVHNSLKHYLWFTETIISTIIQTERSKENSLETFIQIIRRKLDENEVDVASRVLERMEVERTSSNSTYSDKCHLIVVTDNTSCGLPGSSYELLDESKVGPPPLSAEYQLPGKVRDVSIETTSDQQLHVLTGEPRTESYQADILHLPDFCMEYEITENGTVLTQNSNNCNNDILVFGSTKDEKKYLEQTDNKRRRKKKIHSTSDRSFDVSNSVFDNSTYVVDDGSDVVDVEENKILTVLANSPTAASSQMSSSRFQDNISQDDSLQEADGECTSSVPLGINNSNVNNKKVALVVTEEDLRIYKNNIQALAERLSTTCNELSVEEIVETLQAYVVAQI